MPATVAVNKMGVVHVASSGVLSTFPDACKTPTPAGPVPIPYPNIAMSTDSTGVSTRVKCDGNGVCLSDSSFSMSTGDEAGSIGGIVSGKIKGKAEFMSYSFDVKVEGKNVARGLDMMVSNEKNTPPMPLLQPPVVVL